MTLTLELPAEIENALSEQADRLGMSLDEYALYLLQAQAIPIQLRTGAELVAYWQEQDLIGTRDDIEDSAEYARELRAQGERRGQ